MSDSVFSFVVRDLDHREVSLSSFQNQVLLIVNVASRCGFTPQYTGLEALYQKYKSRGFSVLGFPCNQFGAQEPGTEKDIKEFCALTYPVTFPVFAKIEVNGEGAHPLYQFLKKSLPGLLGTEAIKWNFTKFLVDRAGKPTQRFAPTTSPESLAPEIERLL